MNVQLESMFYVGTYRSTTSELTQTAHRKHVTDTR